MEQDPPGGRPLTPPDHTAKDFATITRALAAAVQRVSIPITDYQSYGIPEEGSHVLGRGVVVVPGWTRDPDGKDHFIVGGTRLVYLRSSSRGAGGWLVQRRYGWATGWPPTGGEWRAGCAGYHGDPAHVTARQVQGYDVGSSVRMPWEQVLGLYTLPAIYQGTWEALRKLSLVCHNEARRYEAWAAGMMEPARGYRGPANVVED